MNKLGQRSMTGRGGGLLSSEGCYTFCAFVCHTDPFRILQMYACRMQSMTRESTSGVESSHISIYTDVLVHLFGYIRTLYGVYMMTQFFIILLHSNFASITTSI